MLMTNEDQPQPFKKDSSTGGLRTWKDEALAGELEEFGDAEADEIDRRDTHAQTTTGKITLEESGFTPRQAAGILNSTATEHILEGSRRQRAEEAAAAEAQARADGIDKLVQLLRETDPDHPPQDPITRAREARKFVDRITDHLDRSEISPPPESSHSSA